MKILAIDTAANDCLLGLIHNGSQHSLQLPTDKRHASLVLAAIDTLLTNHRIILSELDALAYVAGPASFTGVRIAASVVQALAFAKQLPVILIPSLQYIAQSQMNFVEHEFVAVAMDAFMHEIYWGEFHVQKGIMQPLVMAQLLKPEQVTLPTDCTLGIGNAWDKYITLARPKKIIPVQYRPEALLDLASYYFKHGQLVSVTEALPMYLREEDAWVKMPKQD